MMATLLPRGFDDVLLDSLVSLATAYATEQAALDAGAAFTADRDLVSPPDAEALKLGPWMVFGIDSIRPDISHGGRSAKQFTYTVTVDLYAAKGGNDDESDKKAKARLSYLKEQALAVLDNFRWTDFGQTVGTLGNKRFTQYTAFAPSADDREEWVVGGQLTYDITAAWSPEDIAGTALVQLSIVNTGKWSALYNY